MIKKISKTGCLFLLLFLVLVGYSFYESQTCSGMYCGFVLILTSLPWVILFMNLAPISPILGILSLVLSIAINAVISFYIGVGLEKLYFKFRKKN
ncbi:MAG: hypothetical protein VX028_00250 [Nanoarchaeota archaeon]|nr:hypothetical protein [Nanoarchaeota archaeon]MEC8339008.1 hypothetical protein [Nanoarchaeota archaeon]